MAADKEFPLRIEHDHDALDIIDGVNVPLKPHGLELENDNKEHDGYELYRLKVIGKQDVKTPA